MTGLYERQNPHRLYRDKENAVIAGVCAGVADYFGFNRKGVRILTGLAFLMPPFAPFAFVSYVVLAIVLPVKPMEVSQNREQADFWRGVSNAPADVFGALNHRFKELNLRLQRMEAHVTSKEFEIDRELKRNKRPERDE
jgi:phage shock protein C